MGTQVSDTKRCELCAARGRQTPAAHYLRLGDPVERDLPSLVWVLCVPCRNEVREMGERTGTVPPELSNGTGERAA